MDPEIITVRGPVPARELGLTSMHEHVIADGSSYFQEPRGWAKRSLDPDGPLTLENVGVIRRELQSHRENLRLDDAEVAVAELRELADLGGRTVVEQSCSGLRADVQALRRVSEESAVHIVAATGLYIEPSWPRSFLELGVDELQSWMVGEVEEGIGGTGIRAGHIGEIGVSTFSEREQRALRAAAGAAVETGLSMTIHPGFEPGIDGRAIADLLDDTEIPPERVVLGHSDAFFVEHSIERLVSDPSSWALRLAYHRELLARGYNLAVDCFGHDWSVESRDLVAEADWQRAAGLLALLREGHASQLVLGCDVFMRASRRNGGGLGYTRLLEWLVPLLRALEVPRADVEQMLVANPARLLGRA